MTSTATQPQQLIPVDLAARTPPGRAAEPPQQTETRGLVPIRKPVPLELLKPITLSSTSLCVVEKKHPSSSLSLGALPGSPTTKTQTKTKYHEPPQEHPQSLRPFTE